MMICNANGNVQSQCKSAKPQMQTLQCQWPCPGPCLGLADPAWFGLVGLVYCESLKVSIPLLQSVPVPTHWHCTGDWTDHSWLLLVLVLVLHYLYQVRPWHLSRIRAHLTFFIIQLSHWHCGQLHFRTLAIPFTPLCQCLSEETLKAVGPFYLVSMPREVKDGRP